MMKGPESRCLHYLPLSLWTRILSFLPALTIPIARAVCKYFLAIIDDPFFVSLHLRSYPFNLRQTRTLTLRYFGGQVVEIESTVPNAELCAGSITTIISHLKRVEKVLGNAWWSVAGSMDGLLLMFTFDEALLWNPSIGRARRIHCPSNSKLKFRFTRLGLGYDGSLDDYKALAIVDYATIMSSLFMTPHDEAAVGAWVYSVKRGSWESVGLPDCRHKREVSESLCFKGGLVWIEGVDTGHSYYHHLARFDFATEKFSYTWVPYPIKNNLWIRNRLVMIDGGSSLGVWGLGSDNLVYIWAMDATATSWTRLCNIREGSLQIGSFRNREVVWEYCTKGARPKISLYNDTEEASDQGGQLEYMGVYIESLVLKSVTEFDWINKLSKLKSIRR